MTFATFIALEHVNFDKYRDELPDFLMYEVGASFVATILLLVVLLLRFALI